MDEGTVQYAVLRTPEQVGRRTVVRLHAMYFAMMLLIGASMLMAPLAGAQGGARSGGESTYNRDRKPPTPQQIAQFEQFIENRLFENLKATDEQRVKLRQLKKRLDDDKNQLFREEGQLRRAMRVELQSATPNDSKLTELLAKWPELQRRRIDIQEREQRELAKFLTPWQRARFFAFEDEFRRTRQDTQWGRGERGGPGGRSSGKDSVQR